MTNYPKISVIIPSLNQGDFIETAIHSVIGQNYPALELWVIDGGSTDKTLEKLRTLPSSVHWISEKDAGQTDAINKGLRRATGDILAYLNADDVLLPGSLFVVAEAFQNHPNILWLTGRCKIVDRNLRETRSMITLYKNLLLGLKSLTILYITNYISQPSTFWRRELMEEIGYFDENLRFVMDYEYWLRAWQKFPPLVLPRYLAAFRIQPQSKTTSSGHSVTYIREEKDVIQRHTRSWGLIALHDLHRFLMTFAYSVMNR